MTCPRNGKGRQQTVPGQRRVSERAADLSEMHQFFKYKITIKYRTPETKIDD